MIWDRANICETDHDCGSGKPTSQGVRQGVRACPSVDRHIRGELNLVNFVPGPLRRCPE